jgi:nucleoside-diphosphate-sugar epimerase
VFVPWIKKGALLIHISSGSVLGKGEGLGNESPPNPTTFPSPEYAVAKLEQDQYLEQASGECGFRVIFLRPAVLYSSQGAGMVSTIIRLARRGLSLRLYPRGARQHLANLDLLADVVRRVIQHDRLPSLSRFVVADPYTVSNRELEATIRGFQQTKGLPLPLPAHWMGALLRRAFHSKHPMLDFKTMGAILGVMASDIVYDPSETYRLLNIDPSCYSIEKTLLPAIVESLKQ